MDYFSKRYETNLAKIDEAYKSKFESTIDDQDKKIE